MNVLSKREKTHKYRRQTSGYQWREGSREGHVRGMRLRDTNHYV